MKNLYRIGIFVVVCLITALLAVYLFDRFLLDVKDIGGRLPQVYENKEQLEAAKETRGAGGTLRSDETLLFEGAQPPDESGSMAGALGGSGTEDAEAVRTELSGSVVTKTTAYVIEEYHRQTHEVEVVTERMPAQYIGMSRQELEDALVSYAASPSLKDVERGLTDVRLVSFSPERVMVRKSFYIEPEKDFYYLTEEQGYVVVYFRNMGTLFCETGIEIDDLPERLQREIRRIKTIETEEELYGFLESYSS